MVRKGTQTVQVYTWGPNGVGKLTIKLTQGGNVEKRVRRVLACKFRLPLASCVLLKEWFNRENQKVVRDYEAVFVGTSAIGFPHTAVIYYRIESAS